MKVNKLKFSSLIEILVSVICFFVILSLNSNTVHAVSNTTTLNFQARLLTSAGAVVPDGTYNIDFKIYNSLLLFIKKLKNRKRLLLSNYKRYITNS